MRSKRWTRLLAVVLCVAMTTTILPGQALAYLTEKSDLITIVDENGTTITEEASWEETFPYGTFAFDNSQLTIAEGGEEGVIRLYRLGGTTGRAEAYVTYVPPKVEMADGSAAYTNAAGAGDVQIWVEDPLPIAQYQPLGKDPEPLEAEIPAQVVSSPAEGEAPAEEATPAESELELLDGSGDVRSGDLVLTLDQTAEAWQWQVLYAGQWEPINDGTEDHLLINEVDLEEYDFRCIYTVGGEQYGSISLKGEAYVRMEESVPEMPEDVDLNPETTYSELPMDPENPYEGWIFSVVFADGEWVKEIHISAPEDDTAEPDKFGLFTIVDCQGGSLYDTANTLTLHVTDNDAAGESTVGFAVTELEVDKAEGVAQVTVQRTGDTTELITVDYETRDGAAVAGTDYMATSGSLIFYADVTEQTIEIPLVDDQVASEDRLDFQVILTGVRGAEGKCTLGGDAVTVRLWNSGTGEGTNLASLLQDGEAADVSGGVSVSGGSVAPVGAESITGSQTAQEVVEPVPATIVYGSDGDVSPLSHTYDGTLVFTRDDYNVNQYWNKRVRICGTMPSYPGEWNDFGKDGIFGNWSNGSAFGSLSNVSGTQTVPIQDQYIGQKFSQIGLGIADKGSDTSSKATATVRGTNGTANSSMSDTLTDGTGTVLLPVPLGSTALNSVVSYTYDQLSLNTEKGTYSLSYAYLQRRNVENNLGLKIHTANDSDTKYENAALIEDTLYDAMKPEVTIVSGAGGVNTDNKLFVGSRLQVDVSAQGGFAIADNGVYFTDASGDRMAANASRVDDDTWTIDLVWNGIDLKGQYTLNVEITRKQNVSLDITPSVDRMEDGTDIDAARIVDGWNRFWNHAADSSKNVITLGVSQSANNGTIEEKTYSKNQWTSTAQAVVTQSGVENLQWINFNRSANDYIVFNGRLYAGNEQIWLQQSDLSAGELNFLYYHEDFLSAESPMKVNMDGASLYLDVNCNGQIDGHWDSKTGVFVLDTDSDGNTIDQFLFRMEEGEEYSEQIFAPVPVKWDSNGNPTKYAQYFLKVNYALTPRCLKPTPDMDADAKAQVLPAFVSNITDPTNYAALTREQRAYRYIISGKNQVDSSGYVRSGDNRPMFGEAATARAQIDIPLGGDTSPTRLSDDGESIVWEPNYQGNLLYPFSNPEPIYIENSLAGQNIPIAKLTGYDASTDTFTYESSHGRSGADLLNGFLGSFTANTTYTLCVQEQKMTTDEIAAANGVTIGGGDLSLLAEPAPQPEPEGSSVGEVKMIPNAEYLKAMEPGDVDTGLLDMSNSPNEFPEFNLDLGIDLPSSEIGASDFVNIVVDGNQVGFTIGLPMGGYNSNGDAGASGVGSGTGGSKGSWNSPATAWKSAGSDLANIGRWIRDRDMASFKENSDSFKAATADTDRKLTAKGFSVEFSVAMAFIFEYNALDNDFYFQQFAVAAGAGLQFTAQYRFSPFPIAYIYMTVGVEVELSTGASVERLSVTGDELLSANQKELGKSFGKGNTMLFDDFGYKSFDIQFKGKILVEAFTDSSCTTKYPGSQSGYLQSGDANEAVTVTLLQQDGQKVNQPMYLRVTSLEDNTVVTSVKPVTDVRTETSWDGFNFSPEAFIEAGIGIGIEILKLEAYIKVNIGCSMAFGKEVNNQVEAFNFEEFEFGLGVGLHVVLLLFSYDLDLIHYTVSYEQGEGWSHSWSAANGAAGGSQELSVTDRDGNTYGVRITLPGDTSDTQEIYGPGGDLDPLAINPPNGADVPFQMSGYGSSADAFKLADGLITGYDYQVVTSGSDNYVIYTISRSGADSSLDNSMLVLSKLQLTGSGAAAEYGLVNPADASASTPYIPLDDDGTGDLDFNAWVDGRGVIHAAWVSYAAEGGSTSTDIQTVQAEAAKNTVVQLASYTPGQSSFTKSVTLSGATGSHVFLPNVLDGSIAVYGKAVHYTEEELAAATEDYSAYLASIGYDPAGDANTSIEARIGQYRLTYQTGLWNVYGKGSQLCVSVNGTETPIQLAEGQTLDNLEAVKIGDTYYVAYTTSQMQYMKDGAVAAASEADDLVTIKRLFLRTFTMDENSAVIWTDHDAEKDGTQALLLRTLYDYDINSDEDGLYVGGALTAYQDPYFANLQFLNAQLGELKGTSEDFETMSGDQSEDFLLFEMNGSTYVVPQDDLESIVTDHSGRIIPFFTPAALENENGGTTVQSSTGRTEVTIGADGAGNLAAVYVGTAPGTSGNALYLTRYDPETTTWGAGTMLAMEHMQVHEDAITYGLTYEQTELAHLGKTTGNEAYDTYIKTANDSAKGSMDYFTFSNLQIALGQSEADSETLLVLTQGSLNYLKEVENSGETVLAPMTDDEAQAAYAAAGSPANRKPGTGIYAVSYGVGRQDIGEAELSFSIYDFTAGSELEAYVAFVNTGDVALRASQANPLTVELNVSDMGTPLATWEITDNVLAGQKVELSGTCAPLTTDLEKDACFTITVKEDGDYFNDHANLTSGSLLTVADKVELGFESFSARAIGVDANGNVQVYVDTQISNRGSMEAEGVYLQFSYEDADGNYKPLDLTGNTLQVSTAQDLETLAASQLTSGVLALSSSDGQNLASGRYRTLSGTVLVPSAAFADSLTGGMNLRVELFSDNGSIANSNAGVLEGEHDEYNTGNNVRMVQVAPTTTFTSATQVTMPLGTTMRLPVSITTTTGSAPSIAVVETTKDGEANHLGALYYQNGSFSNGSETGTLVLSPVSEGTGIIHLQDRNTNTTYAITYTVGATGDGINIFNDTDLFAFEDYDPGATGSDLPWKFETGIPTWGETEAEVPLNGDLTYGKVGQKFTFETQAESIKLYFAGKVKVTSTFPGFSGTEVSVAGGKNGFAEIKFGDNQTNYTHTVTVEITGSQYQGSSYAAFDRVVMTYGQAGTPLPAEDADAPHLYWSRSFPDTASVQTGQRVDLILYVLDNNGIASVTVNGTTPENTSKNSSQFWTIPVTVTKNGTLTAVATDLSGKSTRHKIQVDWFHTQPDSASYAPGLTDVKISGSGNNYSISWNAAPSANAAGTTPTVTITQIVAGEEGLVEGTLSGSAITANGWYLVTATDGAPYDDQWSAQMVYMGSITAAGPIATLTYEPNPAGGVNLKWTARTESSGTTAAPTITSVTLNGQPLTIDSGKSGTVPATHGGTYTLEVKDSKNQTGTATLEVTVPVYVKEGETLFTVTNATDGTDGKVTIHSSALLGGKAPGSYEWRLVKDGDTSDVQWSNTETITNLTEGDYTLYVRDANDPNNTATILSCNLTVGSEKITVTATQKEAESGADIAWSVIKAYGAQEKITTVSINGQAQTVDQPDFALLGTWHTTHAGSYEIKATDAQGTSGSYTLTVKDIPIYLTEGGVLYTVTNATNDAGDNGVVTIDSTVLLGGTYDAEASKPAQGSYKGSYEWRLVKDEDTSTLAVLLSEDEQWVTDPVLDGLTPGDYTLYVRDANDKRNEATVLALQLKLELLVGDERITLTLEDKVENGSHTLHWSASKGYGAKEPILSVAINGKTVNTESGMSLSGTLPISFGGDYTLTASDNGTPKVTQTKSISVENFPITISDVDALLNVVNPWNQAGDNGSLTLNLTAEDGTRLITGGLYDANLSDEAAGTYMGSYEWCLEPAFVFDSAARLQELKAQWLAEHPEVQEIPETELASMEARVEQEAVEAENQWLTELLQGDSWNTVESAGNTVTALTAGDYVLLIRDRQEPTNAATLYCQDLTFVDERITITAESEGDLGGQNNGSVTVNAQGGYLDQKTYQYIIRPITVEDAVVDIRNMDSALDREQYPGDTYPQPKWDAPDFSYLTDPDEITDTSYNILSTATLGNLPSGWYQVAVRPMLDVSATDLLGLARRAATCTAAEIAATEAAENATEAGITRQVTERINDLSKALENWRNAEMPDQAAAEAAYKALINSDPTVLAALEAWRNKEFAAGIEKDAYDTAVQSYFTALVTNAANKAVASTAQALEQAQKAYDEEYARLMQIAADAYAGANADIGWGNGTTMVIYVDFISNASRKIEVRDLRYPDDKTVSVHFTSSKKTLSDKAEKQLIADNAERDILATSSVMNVVIPAGTLSDGVDLMAMLMPFAEIPTDSFGTVVQYTDLDGETHYVPWSVVTQSKVWYIADRVGTYELVINPVTFIDVEEDFWGYDAISFVAARVLFQGIGNDKFAPDGTMTRGMLVTVLGRLAGIDPEDYAGRSAFSDVDPDSWYGPYVAWAAENDVVQGVGGGRFDPDAPITREQLCTMLVRYLDDDGIELPVMEQPPVFSDEDQVNDWAQQAVERFRQSGIMEGANGAFMPQNNASRAEVAAVFQRLIITILTNA